ncbi:MAG: cysteine--tRNA ligase, partial [Candidatus Omnitrophica bacterium]|nr:cysteine--tRNA ligase [Candidatus Omnitrophota bacterium]
ARSLYIFDVVRRYLRYRGFEVKFVRNITDIDDKIINRARQLKTGWQELVKKYIDRYYEDLAALGIQKGDFEPRATENIPDMIEYIAALIDKGFAYATPSGVYFSVRKFQGYGKLSGQSIDQMQSGSRIEPDETKEDPLDFALWKRSNPDEPSWDSPWGAGRPGWHIECSVMSQKFLKTDTLDIHAGGRDLIFPHHENEIAQAEALTGKPFARFWIHHGLLTINGQKMSKSLGNFVTVKDFIAKFKNADLLKILFLSAHYSHPVDYTDEKMEEARRALERIMILSDKIRTPDKAPGTGKEIKEIEDIKSRFIAAMDDDFNTPQALACVFDLVNAANKNIQDPGFTLRAGETLKELAGMLGIALKMEEKTTGLSHEDIEARIKDREEARRRKEFALSDKIRKELEEKGVILEDTKEGTSWRRKL